MTSYVHSIQLAHRAYLANEFRRARELIDGCPEEHRHWEWRYLWRLLRSGRTNFEGHEGEVADVAIAPNGRLVVSVSATHLRGWDPETGEERFAMEGSSGLGVTFSPEGDRFAVAGGSITIRDVKDRRELAKFSHPKLRARCVAFDPEGKRIAGAGTHTEVGSSDGVGGGIVVVWDIETGKELHRFDKLSTTVYSVAFSPDGRLLAAATVGASSELPDASEVQIWNLEQQAEPTKLRVRDKIEAADDVPSLFGVAFTPDGLRLAAGCRDGNVYFWNTKDWKRSLVIDSSDNGSVWDIAFAADGKTIATVGSDRVVRIHETAKGAEVNVLRGHAHQLMAVALSRDGKHLVAVGGYRRNTLAGKPGWDTKGEAIAWHLDTPQGMRVIEGGSHLFPPDWRFVVTGGLGSMNPPGKLSIHDIPSGERRDFSPPPGPRLPARGNCSLRPPTMAARTSGTSKPAS